MTDDHAAFIDKLNSYLRSQCSLATQQVTHEKLSRSLADHAASQAEAGELDRQLNDLQQ